MPWLASCASEMIGLKVARNSVASSPSAIWSNRSVRTAVVTASTSLVGSRPRSYCRGLHRAQQDVPCRTVLTGPFDRNCFRHPRAGARPWAARVPSGHSDPGQAGPEASGILAVARVLQPLARHRMISWRVLAPGLFVPVT